MDDFSVDIKELTKVLEVKVPEATEKRSAIIIIPPGMGKEKYQVFLQPLKSIHGLHQILNDDN